MESVVQLIQSIGFPVAMCLLMAWYIKYQNDNHKTEINEIMETYRSMNDGLKDSINNLAQEITKMRGEVSKEDAA